MAEKVRLGITMGDPSGIGAEVIIKAINKAESFNKVDFIIIGDRWVFNKYQILNLKYPKCRFIDLNNVQRRKFSFGRIKAEYGRACVEYLNKALDLIRNKEIDCLVTCPISKESINLAGFRYSGQTEFLAKHTQTKDYVMMLLNKKLKISLLTRHIPVSKIPSSLSKEMLYKTIFLTYCSLSKLFLLEEPRIVVCGLNPHASDNGLIGDEENKIIKPVIKRIRRVLNQFIEGPLSADAAILKAKENKYDCVIAMYHDQALIPLKLLDAKSGVNLTLGLPFIRTSPLHGTAFDISGKNLADCSSLIESIKIAVRCTLNQRKA